MPLYKYLYKTDKEEKKEEKREFANKGELYKAVRMENGVIISAEEVKPSKVSFKFLAFHGRMRAQEVIAFARNLAVMIDAGLSVSRALLVLQKQSKNKKVIVILEDLSISVQKGDTFSKALKAYPEVFPDLFVSMVKAGEESGKLPDSLRVIANQLEKAHNLSKKIKGAMIYPTVIVTLMMVIGFILMVYMVPTLTEVFKGLEIELPLLTRVIIAISDFLIANFVLTLATIFIIIGGSIYFLRTQRGKHILDFVVLHLPVIGGMSKEINAARTARTLASLIASGVDIVGAIQITSSVVQNHYFKNLLNTAAEKVETGEPLSASLSDSKANLYPVFVSEMLAVGEETGNMAPMLENIATYFESEIDQKTKNLSAIIEPFLMIIIGIAVGLFAVSMMLPTYSLVDAIQ